MRFLQLLPLLGALFALYIIWGAAYFVTRIGVESWPPLHQTFNVALIGLLLLAVGNGLVTVVGASKRVIGHCCSRGRHCPAVYSML